MNDDETAIRTAIDRWATAVHEGDLATVTADRADDIVLFDVPPPHDGVRGLEAYRAVWPGFFSWQAAGGSFEVVETHVTAGAEVAFAWVLIRCDTPEGRAARPDKRLRVTLGLRKAAGGWIVHHEHHSFPLEDG